MTAARTNDPLVNADQPARRLRRQIGQPTADCRMIDDADRVMDCRSGSKDSRFMRALTRIEPLQLADAVLFDFGALGLNAPNEYPAPRVDQ